MTGQYWVDRGRISDLAETLFRVMRDSASPARSAFGMTPRERQIVAAVLSGYTNRGIAQKLSISEDRKSTRLNSSHITNLVCRLLLEKKKYKKVQQIDKAQQQ